jgi:hypothetical protein
MLKAQTTMFFRIRARAAALSIAESAGDARHGSQGSSFQVESVWRAAHARSNPGAQVDFVNACRWPSSCTCREWAADPRRRRAAAGGGYVIKIWRVNFGIVIRTGMRDIVMPPRAPGPSPSRTAAAHAPRGTRTKRRPGAVLPTGQ